MKHIFTFLMLLFVSCVSAQTANLIVFNNTGEQFFVILNGIKQNVLPKTNVRIEGLKPVAYDIKLIFADGETGDIDKRVFLEPNLEYSTRVVIKKAKKGKLRLLDMVEKSQSTSTAETIAFRQDNAASFSDQQSSQETPTTGTPPAQPVANSGTQQPVQQQPVQQQPVQQQPVQQQPIQQQPVQQQPVQQQPVQQQPVQQQSVQQQPVQQQGNGTHTHADGTVHNAQHQPVNPQSGMHTHADGTVHYDHDHNTPATPPAPPAGTTQIHTDVTVHYDYYHNTAATPPAPPAGTHTHADGTVHHDHDHAAPPVPQAGSHTHADGTVHHGSHYPGPTDAKPVRDPQGNIRCSGAVADIEPLIKDINAQTFSSEKKAHAKSALAEMCINSDQAYRIVNEFTFESDKLEIAKLCYRQLVDKSGAEKLISLFTFEATKKDFREYVKNNK